MDPVTSSGAHQVLQADPSLQDSLESINLNETVVIRRYDEHGVEIPHQRPSLAQRVKRLASNKVSAFWQKFKRKPSEPDPKVMTASTSTLSEEILGQAPYPVLTLPEDEKAPPAESCTDISGDSTLEDQKTNGSLKDGVTYNTCDDLTPRQTESSSV